MSNRGGCSHLHPGIGDVAYVKDLMSRRIATKEFNCSRFGTSIARGLGWVYKIIYLLNILKIIYQF